MDLQVALNSFAKEAFRDQGDRDYISARLIYRLEFREQFLWSGLQAIEKYLKAILLFNDRSSRYKNWPNNTGPKFRHDLVALYDAVKNIPEIKVTCPGEVEVFIKYLKQFGINRYFDRSTYTIGNELLELDKAVWHIRRYCQQLHWVVKDQSGQSIDIIAKRVDKLNAASVIKDPWKFRIRNAFLENVLSRPQNDPVRQGLIWQNLYYGARRKGQVIYSPMRGSANPPSVRGWSQDPSLRSQLEKYIQLP